MKDAEISLPVLAVLAYNRADLLDRCLKSVDYPAKKIVIINNGNDPDVAKVIARFKGKKRNVDVYHNKVGLGVAASWNFVASTYDAPYWFFLGSDIQLHPGSIKMILQFTESHKSEYAIIGGAHGMSYFFLTKTGVSKVGKFDENFYPAYFEDTDFDRRAKLVDAKFYWIGEAGAVHGEAPNWGSSTITSDPVLLKKNGITFESNRQYYLRKWGGCYPNEKFSNPFNDPLKSVQDWKLDPEMRKRNAIW